MSSVPSASANDLEQMAFHLLTYTKLKNGNGNGRALNTKTFFTSLAWPSSQALLWASVLLSPSPSSLAF